MNARDSDLGYALLALLQQAPRSGYDLRKLFETNPIGHFSDSPGAIYPALGRLRRRGWIEPLPGGAPSGRRRQALRPTALGRRAFRAWLQLPVEHKDVAHGLDGLVLRFAFMSENLERRAIVRFLDSLREAIRAHLGNLERFRRVEAARLPPSGRLAFESGVAGLRGYLRWAERALREIKR
jgi:DNA-binding PadR family transcriptional regulator